MLDLVRKIVQTFVIALTPNMWELESHSCLHDLVAKNNGGFIFHHLILISTSSCINVRLETMHPACDHGLALSAGQFYASGGNIRATSKRKNHSLHGAQTIVRWEREIYFGSGWAKPPLRQKPVLQRCAGNKPSSLSRPCFSLQSFRSMLLIFQTQSTRKTLGASLDLL